MISIVLEIVDWAQSQIPVSGERHVAMTLAYTLDIVAYLKTKESDRLKKYIFINDLHEFVSILNPHYKT